MKKFLIEYCFYAIAIPDELRSKIECEIECAVLDILHKHDLKFIGHYTKYDY